MGPAPTAVAELEALTEFLYLAPVGLAQTRLDGKIVMLNPKAAQLLASLSGAGELVNLFDALAVVAPDLRHRALSLSTCRGLICEDMHLQMRQPRAGRASQKEVSLTLHKLDDSRLMAVLTEASCPKQNAAPAETETLYPLSSLENEHPLTPKATDAYDTLIQFLYQAPIGLLQTTLDGEITMINPMSAQLLMPLVADGNLVNFFDALDKVAPQLPALADAANESGSVICDGLRVEVSPEGTTSQTLSIRLLKLDPKTLVASITDVSLSVQHEKQRLALRLRDASRLDSLTSLPNRIVVTERITHALVRAQGDPSYQFAVLFVDCDRFDRVNTALGTQVGDELLRLIGSRLNASVRYGDGVDGTNSNEPAAARLGGDQFVLVVQGMRDAADARSVAQRVVGALAQPFAIGNQRVHMTVSVGVVARLHAVGDAEDVLQNASIAMHEAKRSGGARCELFEPGMKERATRLGALENDLRRALDEGQLFVVYQPIVSMSDIRCVATEALVRWRHPERGIVPPIEFIGLAEETGLIRGLGEFVLREACLQLAAWGKELGSLAPRTMCVNLSRAQLQEGDFTAQVRAALDASGLLPQQLQLEVTESLAAQDMGIIAQLHQLKALGVSLALDDFGTGYSSLSSLHQLPVDVVKVDRSFVCQIESSMHHRVLVEATVMVAKSLNMSTVAEGIETSGQFEALRRLSCDKGQGYLFSRPMDAVATTAWLKLQAVDGTPPQDTAAED